MDFPAKLIESLRRSERIAALTGAGVSQESGLRTFRDPQSGLWAQYKPEDLASPQAFQKDPQLVWDWYAWRREAIKGVRPNPGHYALARLAGLVPGFTLITQNVDGLHAMACNPSVLELHGNIRRVRCSVCGEFADTWEDVYGAVPPCERCGGLLRPDVIWFGESLPAETLACAVEAVRGCQVFLSIGTSGLVRPAASLAYGARQAGALVVEVNPEPTPLTPDADFYLQGKSGEILPGLVEAAWPE